ncbi:hypothetical protein TRFO_24499 [Tritrichomonas foetus]|uniref:Uncharacterized protein n=1 Tax=Tritrichomonas foetus TaxID=1144522 RepID=A0A1J4KD17_9EUKA|nr:hypothetical protein TRFO_24499 [Tritrichomonas foetus]|eukprot:OHT07333.1 hypothetical protein TRFO_24499 [Tritrichomonas foetus]
MLFVLCCTLRYDRRNVFLLLMIENVHLSRTRNSRQCLLKLPTVSLGCKPERLKWPIPDSSRESFMILADIIDSSPDIIDKTTDSNENSLTSDDDDNSADASNIDDFLVFERKLSYVYYPAIYIEIGQQTEFPSNSSHFVVCANMREAKKDKKLKTLEINERKGKILNSQRKKKKDEPTIVYSHTIPFHQNVKDITRLVIENMVSNVSSRFTNWNHKESVKQLGFIISMYSPSALNLIRQVIPLPSMTTLDKTYRNQIKSIKEALLNPLKIEHMLSIINYPIDQEKQYRCCIAIDAMKFKLFESNNNENSEENSVHQPANNMYNNENDELNDEHDENYEDSGENTELPLNNPKDLVDHLLNNGYIDFDDFIPEFSDPDKLQSKIIMEKFMTFIPQKESKSNFSHLFIALVMPLDLSIDNIVINVLPHHNGQAGKYVRMHFCDLLSYLRHNTRFYPTYVCVDGDIGYQRYHQHFYDFWRSLGTEELHELVKYIPIYTEHNVLYLTDLIHFGKNRRSWLIFNVLTVHPTDDSFYLDVEKIKQFCDLGDILSDLSQLGKIQDMYPIGLFSIPVVKNLMENNCFHEALYILPVALWFESVRNEKLDRSTRILMLSLAFKIYLKFVNVIESGKLGKNINKAGIINEQKKRQYVAPLEALVRALNTIMVMIFELESGGTINFSRLSTMTEEHLNGQIRTGCHRNDSLETILSFITKYNLGMYFIEQMGLKINKKRRDYQGGITFNDDNKSNYAHIEFSDVTDDLILEGFFVICGYSSKIIDIGAAFELTEILYTFIMALYQCHAPIKIPRSGSLKRSGESIISRNMTT